MAQARDTEKRCTTIQTTGEERKLKMATNKLAQGVTSATGPEGNKTPTPELYVDDKSETSRHVSVAVSNITLTPKVGSQVAAHADVEVCFGTGVVKILGLSVVATGDKPPWVALPSKKGNSPGKYFPVVEIRGGLKEIVADAVLA